MNKAKKELNISKKIQMRLKKKMMNYINIKVYMMIKKQN